MQAIGQFKSSAILSWKKGIAKILAVLMQNLSFSTMFCEMGEIYEIFMKREKEEKSYRKIRSIHKHMV